jgi:hypothetical protein
MGREIRKAPPNWRQPKWTRDDAPEAHLVGRERTFHDETIKSAMASWLTEFDRIRAGDANDFERKRYGAGDILANWIADNRAPHPAYYRPWEDAEATWFQLWETVSEGAPVSPAFETKEELARYLAEKGDFWDQHRGAGGWGIERARAFVADGWAPSMMVIREHGQTTRILESKDIPLEHASRHS